MKDKSTTISSSTKQPKTTTTNNHRRAISLKRKPKLIGRKEIINPLSIDALEFDLNKEMTSKLNGGGREEEREGNKALDVVSVHSVDDLIDLNDDKEEKEKRKEEGINKATLLSSNNLHLHSSLHSNIHSSPNLYIQATTTTPNNSPNNSSSFSSNSQIIPNGNTRSLQSEQFKRKNNWETFD